MPVWHFVNVKSDFGIVFTKLPKNDNPYAYKNKSNEIFSTGFRYKTYKITLVVNHFSADN